MCKKSEGALTMQTLEHVQLIMIFLEIKAHVIQKHPKSEELMYTKGTDHKSCFRTTGGAPQRMAVAGGAGRVTSESMFKQASPP